MEHRKPSQRKVFLKIELRSGNQNQKHIMFIETRQTRPKHEHRDGDLGGLWLDNWKSEVRRAVEFVFLFVAETEYS